ncbi:MAG: hypothetical protein FWF77_01965 [Defluviitaleaceae bacterium]|nr:hypothetical protein [Defluviitaleaceae bacterium]
MKKYDMLYPPLVERISAEEERRVHMSASARSLEAGCDFYHKKTQKAAKTRLHQMFGAYLHGNAHKKASRILARQTHSGHRGHVSASAHSLEVGRSFLCIENKPDAEALLALHASTRERLPHIKNFYEFIAAHAGENKTSCEIKTISDLGCGFNPFALPLMPAEFTHSLEAYHAWDIDLRTRDLLSIFFAAQDLPQTAKCADLITDTPAISADVIFMLKLLPVLEAQSPGRGFALANAQNARFLIITYPTKSLGGREKGMEKNYSAAFENAVASGALSNFKPVASEKIGNELVYVLVSPMYTHYIRTKSR